MAVELGRLKLDCRSCSDEAKIKNGCEYDSPIPGAWKVGDYEFQRCPKKIITLQTVEYIRAYNLYEKGILLNPGSWNEQPIKYQEVIRLISYMLSAPDEDQNK